MEKLFDNTCLDEAAKNYAAEYTENENGNGGDDWEDDIVITFKAGAEWMAKRNLDKRIQYESIDSGIKAFAETYSFNIESRLFQSLTKEQQDLWRKEIEEAVVNGGSMGVELARDIRYVS